MHIVHGTWIPHESTDYVQDGAFHLWVETDVESVPRGRRAAPNTHPRQLVGPDLERFLAERLTLSKLYGPRLAQRFVVQYLLLPTHDGAPLPSYEMAPYVDVELPDDWEMASWQIQCFPAGHGVIPFLNTVHFAAMQGASDFQLGSDFVFWWQVSQEIRRLIATDRYLPSLRWQSLEGRRRSPDFQLRAGWEFVADAYEELLRRYVPAMPPVCTVGAERRDETTLYEPESLLRHFAERVLHSALVDTPRSATFDRTLEGTLLGSAYAGAEPITGSPEARALYDDWAVWRRTLLETHGDAAFRLGFRLHEADPDDPNRWHVEFLVASTRDRSLLLPLEEYWSYDAEERGAVAPFFGEDLEKGILLRLGYAARIYPPIWEGMESPAPSGFDLTLDEAFAFLKEHAQVLEDAGYAIIVPAWWTPGGRRRARVRVTTSTPSGSSAGKRYFSLDRVIDYEYTLSIDGEPVSPEEWRQLVEAKTSLVQFRGRWMEVDQDEIARMLATWEERKEEQPALSLVDVMKMEAGEDGAVEWEYDAPLHAVLEGLHEKRTLEPFEEPPGFVGTLRDYQKRGVSWLRYLEGLALGPCLADDMGLGKTVQVIAQLVAERNEDPDAPTTLLIAPTSVLGNWRREIERFAPQLRVLVHHGPGRARDAASFHEAISEVDVVVTSYALARLDEKLLREEAWGRLVIDEAQNIKNPQSAQTRSITRLPAPHRVALTGTPVENRLRDLWSIFNITNPGYLGKEAQFRRAFEIPIQRDNDATAAAVLRRLVEPFILRRLKTDRQIIQDLPEKMESTVYCNLTREQASLYEAVVRDVEAQLATAEGIGRRGLILATLMKLKQICNHPAQFLHDGSAFTADRSHKLERLGEMVEEALEDGDSLLVFTQFTEAGEALDRYFRRTLHRTTYYLHGGTSQPKRDAMVAAFQNPESEPSVFVLSVRAGGTGLNLTRANHVFHFDRWWNPAVEDQATDRAFRIGQLKTVFAHKFVALGTVEERIATMIEEKRGVASAIVGTDEAWLTELDNDTFRDLIALQRSAVMD
jgi:superfamily II DNA or RNA helicase